MKMPSQGVALSHQGMCRNVVGAKLSYMFNLSSDGTRSLDCHTRYSLLCLCSRRHRTLIEAVSRVNRRSRLYFFDAGRSFFRQRPCYIAGYHHQRRAGSMRSNYPECL